MQGNLGGLSLRPNHPEGVTTGAPTRGSASAGAGVSMRDRPTDSENGPTATCLPGWSTCR